MDSGRLLPLTAVGRSISFWHIFQGTGYLGGPAPRPAIASVNRPTACLDDGDSHAVSVKVLMETVYRIMPFDLPANVIASNPKPTRSEVTGSGTAAGSA